jgi:hypothetical protein
VRWGYLPSKTQREKVIQILPEERERDPEYIIQERENWPIYVDGFTSLNEGRQT